MKSITLSSMFNFTSGYDVLLATILENLNLEFHIRPRSFSPVSEKYKKYFQNILYKKEECDLCILPAMSHFDITHPLFHINNHPNRVFFTMWESSRIGDIFIDKLNNMNCIIVPNEWNKQNFINQGCNVPIYKINLFVDSNIFNYDPLRNNDIFVFGCGNNDPRKRLKQTIHCFLKAFPTEKNVKLKIKTTGTNFKFIDSRIEIENKFLSVEKMKEWYSSINVFVSGVSAEGWGFMQHESMAVGRPVIAPIYGGLCEFMNDTNSFPIDYVEVDSEGYWESPGGKWSCFNEDHMIETMRFCYNNRSVVEQKGKIASSDVVKLDIASFCNSLKKIL